MFNGDGQSRWEEQVRWEGGITDSVWGHNQQGACTTRYEEEDYDIRGCDVNHGDEEDEVDRDGGRQIFL